jgi:hypothetical protein
MKTTPKENQPKNSEARPRIVAFCPCTITAAKPEDGKPAKLPRIEIAAYNGGVMNVGYWGPVVVNLAGLKVTRDPVIAYGHNLRDIDGLLGQADVVKNDGKALFVAGNMMSGDATAAKVRDMAANGFKWQGSIGLDPARYSDVAAGASVEVNGQTLAGPFTLIEEGTLNEVSIVPLGADDGTSARIAAEQGAVAPNQKGVQPNMKLDANGKPIEGAQDGQPTAEAIRAAAVAEEARISGVRRVAKDHPEIMAAAIADGSNPEKVETLVLKAELAAEKARNERPKGPGIQGFRGKEVTGDILAAAVSLRAGLKNAEKVHGAETCQKARDLHIHSFTDLVRAALAASGRALEFSRHETREFIQAAFSTRDIANVLSNVANKFIAEGYGTVEQTWRLISAVRPVVDFKANTGVRLIMSNLLQALGNDGKIQHGALSDEVRTVQADTKALMLAVTRKDIINDDLGVLSDIPRRLGFAAARTFNTDFWAAFEAAVATAFTSGHANTTTGALTIATLGTAEALFLALTDADGNPLGTNAAVLLTGGTAYTPAREIYVSTLVVDGTTTRRGAANIYANQFTPAMSRYLSAAPWYLLADPQAVPAMEVAFLNGRQEPFVETADADFDTLGVQMRAYYDYGAAFAEWRAGVHSTGA